MGLKENIGNSPKVAFVIFPLVLAGLGLVVASLVTVNWISMGFKTTGSDMFSMNITFAVWRMCIDSNGGEFNMDVCRRLPAATFGAAQGLYGTGSALAFADLLGLVAFIGTAQFKTNRVCLIILAGISLTTVFLAAGIGMVTTEVPTASFNLNGMSDVGNFTQGYGWGFFVACAGAGLYFLSSICSLFLSYRMKQIESSSPNSIPMNEVGA